MLNSIKFKTNFKSAESELSTISLWLVSVVKHLDGWVNIGKQQGSLHAKYTLSEVDLVQ